MRFCTSALHPGAPVAIESHGLRRGIAWLAALMLAVLPFAARAQDDDLPGRVGRIADFAGQLVLSPQDRPTEWEPIGINYPITSGDNLWVSSDGRAEVDFGGGRFRIAGDTSVHVSRLDDRQLALFIAQGRLIVRVRSLDPGDATRVDTPNTQVTLTRPGLYRIEVAPDREATLLAVREGEAQVALANGAQQALPGQTVTVVGVNPANADIRNSVGVDGFDTWSADRDRRYERGRSTAYVSRDMVGYADLDEHGTWQSYPDYGNVWFPTTRRARLGALQRRLLDQRRWLGADMGRLRARGATRLSTTAAGHGSVAAGAGLPAATWPVPSGRRPSSPGSAARAGASPCVKARRSMAGCRWAGATPITRTGAAARTTAGRITTGPSR